MNNTAENWQDDDAYEHRAERAEQERLAKLAAFAGKLTDKLKEAKDGRRMSGIEAIWKEDDDYYAGVDDYNRGDMALLKPATVSGRPTSKPSSGESTRSTVFVNITQPYVDMSSARVSDMLLPTEDKPFHAKHSPIPEVSKHINNQEVLADGQSTVGDAAKAFIAEMTDKADKAETQIWDWLVESRWHGEMRKVIEQTARIGTSVLKGPYPVKRKKRVMKKTDEGAMELVIEEELKPASKMIDVWNFYPDPSCGDNIHNGRYVFERGDISARQLRDLKGTGYIDGEIDVILKEGPDRRNAENNKSDLVKDNDMFEIWYYTGLADYDDLLSTGCKCDEGETIPVSVVLVNDRVIKASVSILDSGEFPYDVMRWQYRADSWAGTGVARQVRTAQNMVNAASRNLMDNAGVSAGPQIVMRDGLVYPADGDWTLSPLKIWRVDAAADITQVQHAITSIVIPTMQVELQNIIKMALEFAERATSMPLLLQGQQGASTETVGGMQILQANASTVLRRIAKISDDDVTEPHIIRYYEWLMIYGEDDSMKGDFSIEALGSTAFYERDAQAQMIMQMLPMANDPEFRLSKYKLMTEVLKSNKISPERVRPTDEEFQEMQTKMQQNPPAQPQIEVAKIRVDGDMKKAQLAQQSDMAEIQAKNEAMKSEFALKLHMNEEQMAHEMEIEQLRYQMKMMELAQAQQVSLESIKAALSSDVMKLKTQKELSVLGHQISQVATPPTEPLGRAPAGEAYQR